MTARANLSDEIARRDRPSAARARRAHVQAPAQHLRPLHAHLLRRHRHHASARTRRHAALLSARVARRVQVERHAQEAAQQGARRHSRSRRRSRRARVGQRRRIRRRHYIKAAAELCQCGGGRGDAPPARRRPRGFIVFERRRPDPDRPRGVRQGARRRAVRHVLPRVAARLEQAAE